MNKDSPVTDEGDSSAAPMTKRQARAWRDYQKAQARIRTLLEEIRTGDAPAPTVTAPTRRALDFTAQQRGEMCSLYYSGVPARQIAVMFGTTPVTVRAIVKASLVGLTVIFEYTLMGSTWLPTLGPLA